MELYNDTPPTLNTWEDYGLLDLDYNGNGSDYFPIWNPTTGIPDYWDKDNETGQELGESYLIVLDWSTALQILIYCLLIVVTIIGNVLVCLSVVLVRKLRKPGNYLLVSLALSDLFVALAVMPFAIVFEIHGGTWPLNEAFCDLWVSADVLCCTASILNLCAISCDRYQAIMAPLEATSRSTPRRMVAIIVLVWLLSACVSLPPVLLLGNVHESHGQSFCSVSQNFWYQIYATMASFYVPLVVMLIVYFKILRLVAEKKKQMCWKKQSLSVHRNSLTCVNPPNNSQPLLKKDSVISSNSSHYAGRSSGTPLISVGLKERTNPTLNGHMSHSLVVTTKNGNGNTGVTTTVINNNNNNAKEGYNFFRFSTLHRLKKEKLFGGLKEHKASTVLGIIMSAFIICWLPFFILAIMRPFLAIQNIEIPPWISSLFNWLGYANSALNPVIYATLNRDFRLPFKEILCFRCSTLDSLMRREFYQEQYGDDNTVRRGRRSNNQQISEIVDESTITHGLDPVSV